MTPAKTTDADSGDTPASTRGRWTRGGGAILGCLALGIGLASVAGFLGDDAWWLDLAAHFRVHYGAAALLLLMVALLVGARRTAWGLGLVVLLNAIMVGAELGPLRAPSPTGPVTRLLLANVLRSNTAHASFAALLEREQPDVVVLLEVDDVWMDGLADGLASYVHRRTVLRRDNFGIAVFSRLPFDDVAIDGGADGIGIPFIEVDCTLRDGTPVHLVAAHPMPPVGSEPARARDARLVRTATRLAAQTRPVVLAGDLNATPWSRAVRSLRRTVRVTRAAPVRGVGGTWPSALPAPFRIPIDHVFASPELRATNVRIGPHVGSDHRPVIVDLTGSVPITGASHRAVP